MSIAQLNTEESLTQVANNSGGIGYATASDVVSQKKGEHPVLAICPQNGILGLYKQSPPTWTSY